MTHDGSVGDLGLTSASSTGPSQAHLLAVLLGKLNRQTRDKILREMADEYAANGCQLPEVAEELTQAADELLKKLRKAEKVTKRGAVRAVFQIANVEG